MTSSRHRLLLALVLAFVAANALVLRGLHNTRLGFEAVPTQDGDWWSTDPDSQYHMRRLERFLTEEGLVAERDDYLNAPQGSAIPWPPYYTYTLAACLRPWLGAAPGGADTKAHAEWRLRLEHGVGWMPAVFATGTAVVAGLAAYQLTQSLLAALAAGLLFAWTRVSLLYSAVAIGDHHAFVTLLMVLMFAVFAAAMAERNRDRASAGWIYGGLCGFLAGWLLGSWVGGLMYIVLIQAALGLALCSPRRCPGLAPFGASFHLAALVTVLPAVASSPWQQEVPWIVVNLSWFHPLELGLGLCVFLPLLFFPKALGAGTALRRSYPAIVALMLALGSGAAWLLQTPAARGIADGFAWAGRSNEFMGFITESQPLLDWADNSFGEVFAYLGYSILLLPIAWLVCFARRGHYDRSLIWLTATPVLVYQSLVQRRFAESAAPLIAIVLAWAGALLLEKLCQSKAARPRLILRSLTALLVLVGVPLLNPQVAGRAAFVLGKGESFPRGPVPHQERGVRESLEWLRTYEGSRQPSQAEDASHRAVLANWDRGHAIEWAAGLPSVATNFGLYVGLESYLAPWRFLLDSDPEAAEQLLLDREARYVLITSRYFSTFATSLKVTRPDELRSFYRRLTPQQNVTQAQPAMQLFGPWFETMAARLLFLGKLPQPLVQQLASQSTVAAPSLDQSLAFLRAIYVSPRQVKHLVLPHGAPPYASAILWERVPGARVTHASTGPLEIEIDLAWGPDRSRPDFQFVRRAMPGPDGVARIRVPYATKPRQQPMPAGQVRVLAARWRSAVGSGALLIPEPAIRSGATVELR